ncbi:unnamed protein product [Bursaphelenchus okinawaensis]|uniref:Uncharacterized protein n=1 Tax=Bursaphelenchus okinawaensis TaxID=465554 RepID=A0A811JUF6_9BILA|nr:unnamed protein product [Bursaphelenchus okinawaensis]CAG9083452.1 unnamed protein product [Bursaphelenchus okinawaensis]
MDSKKRRISILKPTFDSPDETANLLTDIPAAKRRVSFSSTKIVQQFHKENLQFIHDPTNEYLYLSTSTEMSEERARMSFSNKENTRDYSEAELNASQGLSMLRMGNELNGSKLNADDTAGVFNQISGDRPLSTNVTANDASSENTECLFPNMQKTKDYTVNSIQETMMLFNKDNKPRQPQELTLYGSGDQSDEITSTLQLFQHDSDQKLANISIPNPTNELTVDEEAEVARRRTMDLFSIQKDKTLERTHDVSVRSSSTWNVGNESTLHFSFHDADVVFDDITNGETSAVVQQQEKAEATDEAPNSSIPTPTPESPMEQEAEVDRTRTVENIEKDETLERTYVVNVRFPNTQIAVDESTVNFSFHDADVLLEGATNKEASAVIEQQKQPEATNEVIPQPPMATQTFIPASKAPLCMPSPFVPTTTMPTATLPTTTIPTITMPTSKLKEAIINHPGRAHINFAELEALTDMSPMVNIEEFGEPCCSLSVEPAFVEGEDSLKRKAMEITARVLSAYGGNEHEARNHIKREYQAKLDAMKPEVEKLEVLTAKLKAVTDKETRLRGVYNNLVDKCVQREKILDQELTTHRARGEQHRQRLIELIGQFESYSD